MSYLTAYDLLTVDQLSGSTDTAPKGYEYSAITDAEWLRFTTRMLIMGFLFSDSIELN